MGKADWREVVRWLLVLPLFLLLALAVCVLEAFLGGWVGDAED